MQTIRLTPDQWTAIGQGLSFAVTDIDAGGVRVLLKGRIIGGPEDGLAIDRPAEIAVGRELVVGIVTLALIDTKASKARPTAKLGVYCPPQMAVRPVKEPT